MRLIDVLGHQKRTRLKNLVDLFKGTKPGADQPVNAQHFR